MALLLRPEQIRCVHISFCFDIPPPFFFVSYSSALMFQNLENHTLCQQQLHQQLLLHVVS